MRLVQHYTFPIKTKIPFSEWPEIVHRFLEENHLTSHRFLYFFEDILGFDETMEDALAHGGCARILRDCPALGEIRWTYNRPDKLWLSNIDSQDDFPESSIFPLMKKIHRRYGFSESDLYYFDIDFFGKRTYFARDESALSMEHQPYGSGITLHRDVCGDNYLKLSVDLLHDGVAMDATLYFEAMQKLLPKIKAATSLQIYLSEEEKQQIEEINQAAAPVLETCRGFFGERLPFTATQNTFSSNYSVAKPLKKLAKKYGYAYKLVWNGVYALEKRSAKGNVIYIDVDSGPSHYDLGVGVSYQGVGFCHKIGCGNQTPASQQEADAFLENVMAVVWEFENTLLPSLDGQYPETPGWFIPSDLL